MLKVLIVTSLLAVVFVVFGLVRLYRLIGDKVEKNKVQELSILISEGLQAFFNRVFSSIVQIVFYVSVVLFLFSSFFKKQFSWSQIIAFFIGCLIMGLIAYLALKIIPKLIPIIIKHCSGFFVDGLKVLFISSISLGFAIVGLVILGLMGCFFFIGPDSLIGFGLGIVLAGFFLRIGGGIFKTCADITSDIVSKIEKNIPEFDIRNPATILDLTGDFIGDIVGFGSDILGSFVFSIISCVLFTFAMKNTGYISEAVALKLVILPIAVVSIGLVAAYVSYLFAELRINAKKVENILLETIYLAVIVCSIATYFVVYYLGINIEHVSELGWPRFSPFVAYLIGLIGAVAIAFISEYMTSYRFRPAKYIAREAENGPVISFFNGFSMGLKTNGIFLISIILIAAASFYFAGFYGIALAAIGMLSVTSLILVANIFSPLASNTSKIAQLTNCSENVVNNMKKMDRIGHTTAAIGNGFASSAAVLSTFCLFFTLIMIAKLDLKELLMADIKLISGLIIGISLPFVFSGYLLRSLSKMIGLTMDEVSRQFKEIPYLYEAKARPDIIMASDHKSYLSMNALIIPGLIMTLSPIVIGYVFGIKMLLGFAFGTFLAGFNQGYYWANVGDSLHNAKHFIANGNFGGRDSSTFQNILTADNIGDAFKDLLSPSINILIKSVVIISVLVILLASI